MMRIGQGIDFHKLIIDPSRPLILGGYCIESEYALVGHSDADILLHALADALLGALALGDIGMYFPDTDPELKNMDSAIIVQKACQLMEEKNYAIANIDATLICERPKIQPHNQPIRQSISKILAISQDQISLKATTIEKMGAIGRKEGMAAFVIVLLESLSP